MPRKKFTVLISHLNEAVVNAALDVVPTIKRYLELLASRYKKAKGTLAGKYAIWE